ncbi:MAG: hypothetical protein WA642_21480 [Steroidobacteraceae bacterium]
MSRHSRRRSGLPMGAALMLLMLGAHTTFAQAPSVNKTASPPNGAIASSEDIRDIRGPKPIASPWVIPLVVLAALLVAGSGYAAWRWDSRRQHAVTKLPSEIALERLKQARAFMHPSGAREFSIEVSSIVRDYIEIRFRVMAAHRTTDEFLHDLLESGDSLLAAHRDLLADFLQSCDLAKFGAWNLPEVSMEALLQSARRFVIESAQPQVAKKPLTKSASGVERESYDSIPTT